MSTFSGTASSGSGSFGKAHRVPLNWLGLSLVGREGEVEKLDTAYKRVCLSPTRQSSEIILVRGESGSGKSALVKGLETTIEQQKKASGDVPCFFVSGKYHQVLDASSSRSLARPYGAFVDALIELCHLIRSSEDSYRDAIRDSIQAKLTKEECKTLGRVIPIQLAIGNDTLNKTAPDQDHGTQQINTEHTFHRFQVLLRDFLEAVCAHARLVLFLDDVQWADEASRGLLGLLASDTGSQNLLLIGAVREDGQAVQAIIPPADQPDALRLPVSIITLGPLTLEGVNKIVADVTEQRIEQTSDLSEVIYHKTNGNPYFAIQYIDMLHRQSLLEFSFATNKWDWNVDTIASQTNVSDNVVAVLTDKIVSMPTQIQVALMVGACLGYTFPVDVLEEIMSSSEFGRAEKWIDNGEETKEEPRSVVEMLEYAARAGLIETGSSMKKYKFSHDRVQQSAFALFPDGEAGERLQFCIGKTVLDMSRSVEFAEDWMLFVSVDLLNRNLSSLPMSKDAMSQLCLEAAHKAAEKSAFVSAAGYSDKGFACLDVKTRWNEHYDLCLALTKFSAEMHYAYGNFDKSSLSISEVLANSLSLTDKLRAYNIRVAILGARQDLMGAIREGTAVLGRLGVKSPAPEQVTDRRVKLAVSNAKKLLKGRKAADLRGLPPMTDPVREEAMRLLVQVETYDWRAGMSNLLVLHVLMAFQITLEHGIGIFGAHAVACYGGVLSHLGEFKEAFEYAELALAIVDHPSRREAYPTTLKVTHLVLYHLKKPIFASLDPMLQAYRVAKVMGNIEIAAYCLQAHGMLSAVVGMPLDSLEKQMLGYCDFCREFRQKAVLMELLPFYQLTLNLLGKCDDPLVLSGAGMVEEDFVRDLVCSNEGASSMLLLGYARMLLLFLFDELELAETERLKIDPKNDFVSSFFVKYLNYFFCGMVCLGLAKKRQSRKHKKHAKWYMEELRKVAHAGSPNFIPMLKVLEAEKLALTGRGGDVSGTFDTAIQMAGRCGFRLIKAIACERAGLYKVGCGDNRAAVGYLGRAREEFTEYGARSKIFQMDQKYLSLEGYEATTSIGSSSISSIKLKPHLVETWKKEV